MRAALGIIVAAAALTGCAGAKTYEPADYVLELDYKEDFTILQLSDVHLGNKDDRQRQYDFLELTIDDADADMIVVTGDLFTFADKVTAMEFFDFLDSHGVPWTVVFGNHDEQCYFSIDWMTSQLNDYGSNCVFRDIQDDDVFGNCNFVINLMAGDTIQEQLIFMDSNRYLYGSYFGYDYIKQDQIDWYENMVSYTAGENGGDTAESILFYHIPVPEYLDAWEAAQNGGESQIVAGEKRENVSSPKYNSGFFDKVYELGSTKAMFVGHDHRNDYIVSYKGIYFCYGVNSTDRIYYDEDMMGGQTVTIHSDHTFSFRQIFHTYQEVDR